MGNFIGSAVVPVAMALMWKKCTAIAAISGAIIGLITALVAWLVYAQIEYGEVTLDSTGKAQPINAPLQLYPLCVAFKYSPSTKLQAVSYEWSRSSALHSAVIESLEISRHCKLQLLSIMRN